MLAALLGLALLAAPPPDVPLYFDREITEQDLRGKSLRELDLMRNTVFARQGHTFHKRWLREHFEKQSWYQARPPEQVLVSELDKRNAAFIARFAAAIPRAELEARFRALHVKARTPEDDIELTLVTRALGIASPVRAAATPLDDPSQLDELIVPKALNDLSRRDLRILRNLIYARRGRPFKSPLLREHFERMKWYRANPKYTDARLTIIDRRNIKLVRDAEARLGGPMTDVEQREADADAFLGAA